MRIILPKKEIKGKTVIISGEKARYLISVLRCQVCDDLQVFDGEGNFYKAKISGIENKKVTIDLFERFSCDTESPLNLILVQGILKGEKMDMVIQKTTELGAKEIIPAITERSQVRYTRKVERWRKIAEEAAKQSGRSMIPTVQEPAEFSSWLIAHSSEPLKGFIFWEEGGVSLRKAIQEIAMHDTGYTIQDKRNHASCIPKLVSAKGRFDMHHVSLPFYVLIGPEGGFTKGEVELASSHGLIVVSLGKRILRAETAAISAVALIQFLMGDI